MTLFSDTAFSGIPAGATAVAPSCYRRTGHPQTQVQSFNHCWCQVQENNKGLTVFCSLVQSSRDSIMLDCNSVVTVSFTKHSCSGDGHVLSFCLSATVDKVGAGRDITRTAGHRSDAG